MNWLARLKNMDSSDDGATKPTKPGFVGFVASPPRVNGKISATRERLLAIARELGLPDELVLELPESEIKAAAEQSTWYADAEVRHKLLVFYLRSLAGIEPALPGSVAERHQAERQARARAVRMRPRGVKKAP